MIFASIGIAVIREPIRAAFCLSVYAAARAVAYAERGVENILQMPKYIV